MIVSQCACTVANVVPLPPRSECHEKRIITVAADRPILISSGSANTVSNGVYPQLFGTPFVSLFSRSKQATGRIEVCRFPRPLSAAVLPGRRFDACGSDYECALRVNPWPHSYVCVRPHLCALCVRGCACACVPSSPVPVLPRACVHALVANACAHAGTHAHQSPISGRRPAVGRPLSASGACNHRA